MPRLNKEQRIARDYERFLARVDEKRSAGLDVVAYALANGKAYKHLTDAEKSEYKTRKQADERAKAEKEAHKEQMLLDSIDAEFRKAKAQQ